MIRKVDWWTRVRVESIFNLTTNAIILRLQKTGFPSAHAWRRAWAVQALRNGVPETSVLATAGWSSGAMVARYPNTHRANWQ